MPLQKLKVTRGRIVDYVNPRGEAVAAITTCEGHPDGSVNLYTFPNAATPPAFVPNVQYDASGSKKNTWCWPAGSPAAAEAHAHTGAE